MTNETHNSTHIMLSNPKSYQLREFMVLLAVSAITLTCAILGSFCIPVIHENNTFIPQPVDYFRTLILAAGSSFLVNYFYRVVDVSLIFCKIWVEFLALLLLAYPQKTEIIHVPASTWNMIKRQGYLFGVFVEAIYLGFYLWDLWFVELDEETLTRLARNETDHILHEEVSRNSTLSKCVEVRRKSNSLKKVIYSTEIQQQGTPDETDALIKKNLLDDLTGNVDYGKQAQDDQANYGAMMTSVISRASFPYEHSPVDLQWIMENTLWIILTTLQEIGIALILSISFIYEPEVDDSRFTLLEKYYFNKVDLFSMEVVTPLFLITSVVQILLHLATKPRQRKTTFTVFASISIVLFIIGTLCT